MAEENKKLNFDLNFLDKNDSRRSSQNAVIPEADLDTYKLTVKKNGKRFVATVKATSREDAIRKVKEHFLRKDSV